MFVNASVIANASGQAAGTNVNATKEAGEPNHAGISGGKSVWWSWTAPASGSVTINTAGSSFDTVLGVYTGTSVSALTAVASNDDVSGARTSSVTFNAVAGTIYRIAVDGFAAASGSITLSWNQQVVVVTAPKITVSPVSLSATSRAGTNPYAQSFTVQNTGSGTLNYTISDNATWLSVSPASGTSTGESDTIKVSYSAGKLAAGTYSATITVSDPNSSNKTQTIPVSLTITPKNRVKRHR